MQILEDLLEMIGNSKITDPYARGKVSRKPGKMPKSYLDGLDFNAGDTLNQPPVTPASIATPDVPKGPDINIPTVYPKSVNMPRTALEPVSNVGAGIYSDAMEALQKYDAGTPSASTRMPSRINSDRNQYIHDPARQTMIRAVQNSLKLATEGTFGEKTDAKTEERKASFANAAESLANAQGKMNDTANEQAYQQMLTPAMPQLIKNAVTGDKSMGILNELYKQGSGDTSVTDEGAADRIRKRAKELLGLGGS